MKIPYRGPCEELQGTYITVEDHDCTEHAEYYEETCVETHGLDCGPYERWTERGWRCGVCGEEVEQ